MLEPPDVVGSGEVCALLKFSRATLMRHRARPDFPPARELSTGAVWERRAIVAYAKQRETGKPYLDALRLYRAGIAAGRGGIGRGVIAAVADELGVTKPTIARYLQQLGEIER